MSRPILAALFAGLVLAAPQGAAAQDRAQDEPQPQPQPQVQPQVQARNQIQTPAPASPSAGEAGRYTFHRVGDSFIRLDSTTGQVAQCSSSATGWSCKSAPDERLALEGEIARLQRENASLKNSMLAKGLDLPGGIAAETRPVPPGSIPGASENAPRGAPSEAEIDRAIAYMKNVWKKLVDMMLELQRDIQRKS